VAVGQPALIGPNAIIQMVEALRAYWGQKETRGVLEAVGLGAYFDQPPQHMVPQTEVAALHGQLFGMLDLKDFKHVAGDAGRRTGDYLLAHRIPRPVQRLLKVLPDALAARVLTQAIAKHAWTFAGSGVFSCEWKPQLVFTIQGNPITVNLQAQVPICDYYAATFERIFRVIVNDKWRVVEQACEATGAPACVFVIGLPASAPAHYTQ
jgi:divinyl protochlorophyllide a 8-vinyl-reductase